MARLAKKILEKDVMRLVTDWLSAKHIFYIRMNTYSGKTQSGAWMRQGRKGMADIVAMPREFYHCSWDDKVFRIVWLEVKAPKGIQSFDQQMFQSEVEHEDMAYHIVRDVADLEKAFATR